MITCFGYGSINHLRKDYAQVRREDSRPTENLTRDRVFSFTQIDAMGSHIVVTSQVSSVRFLHTALFCNTPTFV